MFWLAQLSGGVKLILSLVDFVQIVVLALPHFAVMVCVKLVACRVTVNVWPVFSVPFPTLSVLFLGIRVNAFDVLALTVPEFVPEISVALADTVLVPSLLCGILIEVTVFNVPLVVPFGKLTSPFHTVEPLTTMLRGAPFMFHVVVDLLYLTVAET